LAKHSADDFFKGSSKMFYSTNVETIRIWFLIYHQNCEDQKIW